MHRHVAPHVTSPHGPYLYPAADFRRIIRRERARSDRNSHGFSLVAFELGRGPGAGNGQAAALTDSVTRQARFTDIVGWLGDETLGALLPETDGDGALLFSDRVKLELADLRPPPNCRVFTYPREEDKDGPDGERPGPAAGANGSANGPAQLLFENLLVPLGSGDLAGVCTVTCNCSRPRFEHCALNGMAEVKRAAPPAAVETEGIEEYCALPIPRWKRGLDLLGASLALLVLSPVMLAIALLIKLLSPGPLLFRQRRVGYMGKEFECLKFRTMRCDNDVAAHRQHLSHLINSDAPMTKLDSASDPRIIPFGRIVRAMALDELPQLFNVLRGEMSLVGPRPCIPYEYDEYDQWQKQRVDTLPGLTGLWQVSGKNQLTFARMMRLDIRYAGRKTPWQDLGIIARTPLVIAGQVRDTVLPRKAMQRVRS